MVVFSGVGTEGLTDLELVLRRARAKRSCQVGKDRAGRWIEGRVARGACTEGCSYRGGDDAEIQICRLSARDVELATAASVLRAGRSEWPRLEMCDVGLELSRVAKSVTQSKIVNWKSQDRSGAAA